MCTNVTFLLDRAFLSGVSDTLWVQKKKIFIRTKAHLKFLLSRKSQWGVDQQEHRAPSQNKVHSIIDNSVALAVTHCSWGNFLTTEDKLWNFKMYTLLCIWGTFRRHVLSPLLQMVICSSVNWLHLLQVSLQNGLFPHRGAVSLKNRNVSLSGNFTLSLKERIEVFDSAQLSVWSGR